MNSKRVPKRILQSRFIALCDALGKRVAKDWNDIGGWSLERTPSGYSIQEVGDKHCPRFPFGYDCMTAFELEQAINFSLRAIQLDRLNGAASGSWWPDDKCVNDRN